MAKITYQHIQYSREIQYYNKIKPRLQFLLDKNKDFSKKVQIQEKDFFKHLSQAIKIDRLPLVNNLIERLNQNLNTNFKINLFVYHFPVPNALCIPRYTSFEEKCDQLTIIVSQHFLNDLGMDEQMSILGHELGHLLFGHFHIPTQLILQANLPLADVQDIKVNLLKWKTCAEISCDILGFLSCNCNQTSFSYAMLKFTSGLGQKIIDKNREDLIQLLLKQYDDISQALFDTSLTTHPLTPLRLKVIDALSKLEIIKYYGADTTQHDLQEYKRKMTELVDDVVRNIYPEIITEQKFKQDEVLLDLSIAVALADGHIDQKEMLAINSIVPSARQNLADSIKELGKKGPVQMVNELIDKAVSKIREQKYVKTDILKIIRHMITVAASDGLVRESELLTIYNFSKNFGFTKQELAIIIYQMGLK